ncbi:MAG TPA: hypothetical protein EYP56_20745 [Planctomycetaceae bacterium]|nr:hypothetical protein [Planctomycetaceae bacterium]
MLAKVVVVVSKDRTFQSAHELLEKKLVEQLARRDDVVVIVAPHLYDLTLEGPGSELLRAIPGDMIVLAWLYPRAVYWLLDAHRVRGRLGATSSLPAEDLDEAASDSAQALPDRTIWCFDLRRYGQPEPLVEEIDTILASAHRRWEVEAALGADGRVRRIEEKPSARWYPVIDYGRCNHCLECLNFCLFGVFSLQENRQLSVEEPDACRPGCPACSRICPQGAIMFPQHDDPAIAGDPKASRSAWKLDLSQLFSGQSPAELAAAERARALAEQQGAGEADTAAERQTERPDDARADRDELDQLVDRLDDLPLD